MPHEIKAWSYEQRTSRKHRICRVCGGVIPIGSVYLTIAISDTETAGSEKLLHQDEHLDCRMPWYIPADVSPTAVLSRLRRPKRWDENLPVTRFEMFSTRDGAGSVHWHAPELINRMLERLTPHGRTKAVIEMENLFGTLALALVDALGDAKKMRQIGNKMAEIAAISGVEPDLSRLEKKNDEI